MRTGKIKLLGHDYFKLSSEKILRNITGLAILLCISIYTQGSPNSSFIKDNMALTNRQKNNIQLALLDSVATYNIEKSNNKTKVEELLRAAIVQKNDYYKASAYFLLAKYYYVHKPDSMRYYLHVVEPILTQQKRWEDLFRIKGWNIYSIANEGKSDIILEAVNELKNEAKKVHFPEGEEIADQALAYAYLDQKLIKEGQKLYEEVLGKMEARHAPFIKRFYLLRQLLNNGDIDTTSIKKYLNKLYELIKTCEVNHITQLSNGVSLNDVKFVYYRSAAICASREKKMDMAYRYLLEAEKYGNNHTLNYVWLSYYKYSKQYKLGIEMSNEIIKREFIKHNVKPYLEMLYYQADLYHKMSNYQTASQLYAKYITLNDSVMSAKFYNDLAKLRTQHDIDKFALKNKQMDLKAAKDHSQMIIMKGELILMLLGCIIIGYIAFSHYRYGNLLKKAKDRAEESDRLKSAFLANMNHEIRTPLNAIVGFSQVLIDEEDKESRKQYAKIIQNNNILLQRLINDVLDLSKIESNSLQLKYKNIELLPLMNEIYEATLLRMPSDVHLELNSDDNMVFYTDQDRLTQIITNLLNNAIKHTVKGFIRFGYHTKAHETHFFVTDSGEGIPEDKFNDIFTRFVQLKETNKGVGLGLAICKGLVTQMGGRIHVESKENKGSTFTVILPNASITKTNESKEIKGI